MIALKYIHLFIARMRSQGILASLAYPALLGLLSGCGYIHVGRLPPAPPATVIGDEKLMRENSDLRLEKKILQQELALTRSQGDALRMAIENRAADGDTSKRLVEKLNEASRELATLRSNYAKLQTERTPSTDVAALQTHLERPLLLGDPLAHADRNDHADANLLA